MSLQQITIDLKTKQFSSKVIFQHPFWGVDVNFSGVLSDQDPAGCLVTFVYPGVVDENTCSNDFHLIWMAQDLENFALIWMFEPVIGTMISLNIWILVHV